MQNLNFDDAITKNRLEDIKVLIQQTKEKKGRDWSFSDYAISNACRDAVKLGNERIVQLFLDEGLYVDADAHKNGNSGRTRPLSYFAAKTGNLSMVKLLVSKGAQIEDKDRSDGRDNQDAMRAAIEGGYIDIVQYLLENGGSANGMIQGRLRQTFLGKAAFNGHKPIVELLIKHGAKIKNALSLNSEIFRGPYQSYNSTISSAYGDSSRKLKIKHCSPAEVEVWDREKQKLIEGRDTLLQNYSNSIKLLLDHAIGINFEKETKGFSGNSGGITFLEGVDITEFNFLGVSVDSKPITRKMLTKQGLKGAGKAIVTLKDLINIQDKERQSALIVKLEAMQQLQGKIITKDGAFNLVPLADAAKKGDVKVVQVRLNAGINPNQKTTDKYLPISAIVAAAEGGFYDIVKLLAEHQEINQKDRLEALQVAKKNSHMKIAKYLSAFIDVNEKDKGGGTLIQRAIEAEDIKEVKRLLSNGADINLENKDGNTPLLIAAWQAGNIELGKQASETNIELIKLLLANGADPNKYKGDYSPLRAAAQAGSAKAVELLLSVTEKRELKYTNGYEMEEKEITMPWYGPLIFDSFESFDSFDSKEWLEILRLLKEQGADLNVRNRYEGETILYQVINNFPSFSDIRRNTQNPKGATARSENRIEKAKKLFTEAFEMLNFLLENGADPKIACGRDKTTPLHVLTEEIDLRSIEGATEKVIERLLECGADVNASDGYGFTPLHGAAKRGNIIATAYLMSKGADINARTHRGQAPLHIAAVGNPEATKLLIKLGADIHALDENGLSPLAYSQQACIDNSDRYVNPSLEMEAPYKEAQRALMEAEKAMNFKGPLV